MLIRDFFFISLEQLLFYSYLLSAQIVFLIMNNEY